MLLALLVLVWVQFILFPKHLQNDITAVTAPNSQLLPQAIRPKPSSFHLFGSSTVTEVPLDLLQFESSLDLIITGIFSSDDASQGLAYIRNRQGDEQKFKVGDDVFGLAVLDAIYDDHLILRRGGAKKEKLSLSKNRIDSQPTAINKPNVTSKNAVSSARIANHINQSSDWQDMLNKQKYDPSKIAKIASKVSVVTDGQGKISGLKVSQISGAGALMKQGLRSNDQITAVNGVKISYQNILELRKQLEGSSEANVTIMRNGKELNLNLNLSEFQ
ncbi:type II secretion system protein C [Marinicella litoralis]|uniref:Type II secretion system protein C n=1 Tax=Marinicella litoralis TaxID=644220 RepID=A0A4R6XVX0_9GAMM|nr:type II secretion system protein C [Marinicella litoralis]